MENQELIEPPKAFWKFYDLYRRKQISLKQFSQQSGLSIYEIQRFLKTI